MSKTCSPRHKFTSLREIAAVRSILKNYLCEAIELEESRTKIDRH
jgi:hypothetical protein